MSTQPTAQQEIPAAQAALALLDEFRAIFLRCTEALERQAEAAEIQALALRDGKPQLVMSRRAPTSKEVIDAYCERVAGELADAYGDDAA